MLPSGGDAERIPMCIAFAVSRTPSDDQRDQTVNARPRSDFERAVTLPPRFIQR